MSQSSRPVSNCRWNLAESPIMWPFAMCSQAFTQFNDSVSISVLWWLLCTQQAMILYWQHRGHLLQIFGHVFKTADGLFFLEFYLFRKTVAVTPMWTSLQCQRRFIDWTCDRQGCFIIQVMLMKGIKILKNWMSGRLWFLPLFLSQILIKKPI